MSRALIESTPAPPHNPRVAAQLDVGDALIVGVRRAMPWVRVNHLLVTQRVDVSVERERVRHPIERRLRRRELERVFPCASRSVTCDLLREREDIGVLVVRHAEAGA
jgi:hypothetical protein